MPATRQHALQHTCGALSYLCTRTFGADGDFCWYFALVRTAQHRGLGRKGHLRRGLRLHASAHSWQRLLSSGLRSARAVRPLHQRR